ncbi:MAG: carbohydrate kinase family protein [Proteobacteria bacterium]|nr:carbohydrate kinase family protein [Pseudomonadota bacterium]
MSPLITGSLAFDYLMRIEEPFNNQFPTTAQEFSAAYIAPTLSRVFGGCAGNITYALQHLGEQPQLMATAGNDFSPYADYLHQMGVSTEHVIMLPDFYTAQAYVVTDCNHSQFIVFHPGATAEAHRQDISILPPPPLAIISPNGKAGILQHCRTCAETNIPFIFDPGQAISLFSGEEIKECLTLAPYAIFNKGEWETAQRASGLNITETTKMLKALFITNGEAGSQAFIGTDTLQATCVHLGETKNPTGCGDAYRAGLIYGLMRNWEWQSLLNFATVVAATCATHDSGQGYPLSLAAVSEAYQQHYNSALPQ